VEVLEKAMPISEKKHIGMTVNLPYLDNWRMILLVVMVNLIFGLLHHYWGISHSAVLTDAVVCGLTTSVLSVLYVHLKMKPLRKQGLLPASVPKIKWMCWLPQSWLGLSVVFSIVFMILTPVLTELLIRIYQITTFNLIPFVVWKVAYSGFLTAKIIELAILRFVQQDMVKSSDPKQQGDVVVKNPLPGLSAFKKLFDTVTTDFGFNMLIGLVLGGTLIIDHNVVIVPTIRSGIIISGVLIGLIVTGLMVFPVIRQIHDARDAGKLPAPFKHNKLIAWIPEKPILFSLVWIPFMVILSPLIFWLVFVLFDFEQLNFFQFFVIRTIYVTLLTKPVVQLAILRYLQVPKQSSLKGVH